MTTLLEKNSSYGLQKDSNATRKTLTDISKTIYKGQQVGKTVYEQLKQSREGLKR
ncbi:hypothetical protein N6G96_05925 [Pediococcus inopinatus]|uniref:Uncharacterized protein n=1 Tax=Pediococcus inopinatus TaxID=114090 RepID=A0ABZ0Q1N4_9LACO|nr:hypothetical protein [Pediococcus inopinatus]WPC20846.1 hypothetical protein N6G96_05925 [Pediococcus inopinatus]